MWLFYFGLMKVYVFGDMVMLLLKIGDLFIVINGLGWFSSVDLIIGEVMVLGVRVLVIMVKFDGVVVVFVIMIVFVFVYIIVDFDFFEFFMGEEDVFLEFSMMVEGRMLR